MPEFDLIPFGKYKGKPLETLLADSDYARWLANQEWFRDKFISIYKLIQDRLQIDEDSPEHNAMQLKWLNPILLSRLLYCAFTEGDRETQKECDGSDVINVVPEQYGWDIRFIWTFKTEKTPAYVELKPSMGDDYPTVLRSMVAKKRKDEPDADYFLVVREFNSAAADIDALYDFFLRHEINLVHETEVDLTIYPDSSTHGG